MYKPKPISEISVTFRDELLEDKSFLNSISKSKTQVKTFPNEQDWQDLANVVLDRCARLLVSKVVESISVSYYE